ncbi:MAG: potassium channel family protein [Acidimicrobiia bacterium]
MGQDSLGVPVRERYGLILLLIFSGHVLSGFDTGKWVSILNTTLWAAVLLTSLWSPGVPGRVRWLGLVAMGVLLVTAIPFALMSEPTAGGWRLLLLALAQLSAAIAILNRIVRHRLVGLQTVMGAISAYALFGFVMASVYGGIDLLTDTTFLNNVVTEGDYLYFSFVTLTTVGYGDITAASDLAKRLVVVEAFVGQVSSSPSSPGWSPFGGLRFDADCPDAKRTSSCEPAVMPIAALRSDGRAATQRAVCASIQALASWCALARVAPSHSSAGYTFSMPMMSVTPVMVSCSITRGDAETIISLLSTPCSLIA